MIYFTDMYASQLLGQTITDRIEAKIGKVKDIVIDPSEQFPKVIGFLTKIENQGKDKIILLSELNFISKNVISCAKLKEEISFAPNRDNEIFVVRDLLDKQILDIHGSKVVRVNDIKFAKIGEEIRLIAADVGIRGILRRLKVEDIIINFLSAFGVRLKEELIGWNYVEPFKTDIAKLKLVVPYKGMSKLHPADIASIISQVHTEEKTAIFESLSTETAAEALHELEPKIQAYLIGTLDTKKALSIIEKMPSDEAADVLGDLSEEKATELLRLMKTKKAQEVQSLLKHGEETAGGLMTTEFVTIPANFNVAQTIERLRELAPSAETIYYLYVTDEENHLIGVLSLRNLIIASQDKPIIDICSTNVITVKANDSQRKVADVISKYNLLAAPVVDDQNKILGIVTVDDVVDFIIPPLARRKRMSVG